MTSLAEPPANQVTLTDGKKVSIDYKVLPGRVSFCRVGKVVEITCISELSQNEGKHHYSIQILYEPLFY